MPPKLARALNKPVGVAIPAFFGDEAPRNCILVEIETNGLWFSGQAVSEQLVDFEQTKLPEDAVPAVFFPFEQIAYVFDPAQFTYLARGLRLSVASAEPGGLSQTAAPVDSDYGRQPS
jgi:hypothetical protein